jgi:hypothetical protein
MIIYDHLGKYGPYSLFKGIPVNHNISKLSFNIMMMGHCITEAKDLAQ